LPSLGFDRLFPLIERSFSSLKRPVLTNLALLVDAFLQLTAGLRSGNGMLSLAAVARALPLATVFKDRYKRLNRFLDNRLFDPEGLTEGLFHVLFGTANTPMTIPVILDQSTIGPVQLLLAGLPVAGRVLPLSLMTFTYEQIQTQPKRTKSQNFIEGVFFLRLLEAAPAWLHLCFILDRGYARVSLMRELLAQPRTRFIVRVSRTVVIERSKRGSTTRCNLGALTTPSGAPQRFERIRYRSENPVEVDLVTYYEAGHKEPWYLVVPPGSAEWLPSAQVVSLYRSRMHIEQGFRDFKTHLGVRGLELQVRVSERMGRLLMAFTLAYALVVVLGMHSLCEQARDDLEDARPSRRHGTERILSARTVAAMLLSSMRPHLQRAVAKVAATLLARILAGSGLYRIALRL
jgi:hypothetical protein